MAIRTLAQLTAVCILLAASTSIAETLQCRDLNRREYVVDLEVTRGGEATGLYLSGKDLSSSAFLTLSEVKRDLSTGRPRKLIFRIRYSEVFPDYDVEYDLAKKSVIVFQSGRSGKRKIGQGHCLPLEDQDRASESEADTRRINDAITVPLKRKLADTGSTKSITVTLLINTNMKAPISEDDPWFYQGGVDDESPQEVLQKRPDRLKSFGLLVDTDETEYFTGGFNSYRVTGTAKQIMSAIREFKYSGRVVWAGFGSPRKAAAQAIDSSCVESLRVAKSPKPVG